MVELLKAKCSTNLVPSFIFLFFVSFHKIHIQQCWHSALHYDGCGWERKKEKERERNFRGSHQKRYFQIQILFYSLIGIESNWIRSTFRSWMHSLLPHVWGMQCRSRSFIFLTWRRRIRISIAHSEEHQNNLWNCSAWMQLAND